MSEDNENKANDDVFPKRQEHLALLVKKHTTELNLLYVRINLYFLFLAVLVTGVITTIATGVEALPPRFLWGIIAIVALIAGSVSFGMLKISQASHLWINFWKAKIAIFEANNPPRDDSWYFFFDRWLDEPEKAVSEWVEDRVDGNKDAKLRRSEVNSENLKEIVHPLADIWNIGSPQQTQLHDPIGLLIEQFLKVISILWLILLVVAVGLTIRG